MTKRMLIDASHPEETRVAVLDGSRLDEFDIETAMKRPLKGNIYLAKVVRVEPSLQAAFVEYGGNRHGFLAFGEIHPDYYQIPVADRQRLLEMQEAEAEEEDAEDPIPESAMDRAAGPDSAAEAAAAALDVAEEVVRGPAEAVPAFSDDPDAPQAVDIAAGLVAAEPGAGPPDRAEEPTAPSGPAPGLREEPAAEDGTEAAIAAELSGPIEAEAEAEAEPDEDPLPPETIGGEAEESVRERRAPPRFLRNYKIQEVIRRRQILLVQVVKEERGNKGAALTTYVSLAGRFSVLMPNSPRGGGVSRKITSAADRKRLREVIEEVGLPKGMSLIVRTAGAQRPKPEIKRDCEYLLRLWDDIRERTLASTAPALIYEEADLLKRSMRDVLSRDVEEVLIEGDEAFDAAKSFARMISPGQDRKIRAYRDGGVPLFARHGVESQLEAMFAPTVQLKSGGYIVINQAEALVAIDVNSGRATRDRHIEDTALRTNLEAADEIARQLRLRDLAGLIVIDFIDMESSKHDGMVERRLKEALKHDRARIQVGRISHFGLLEMSRQRLRPSLVEHSFITCPTCQGRGIVRSPESAALAILRACEEEGAKRRAAEVVVRCAAGVAMHILNRKRERLVAIEERFGLLVLLEADHAVTGAGFRLERIRAAIAAPPPEAAPVLRMDYADGPAVEEEEAEEAEAEAEAEAAPDGAPRGEEGSEDRRRKRRRRRRGGRREDGGASGPEAEGEAPAEGESEAEALPAEGAEPAEGEGEAGSEEPGEPRGERRRRRRGGRRRREEGGEAPVVAPAAYAGPTPADPFAGQVDDILEAMEAAELAAEAAATPKRAPAPPPVPVEAVAAEAAPAQAMAEAAPAQAMAEAAPAQAMAEAAPAQAMAEAAPAAAVAEPAPAPVALQPVAAAEPPLAAEPVAAPPVQPIVIGGDAEAAPRKRGWWAKGG
jgi:ribonuclease E